MQGGSSITQQLAKNLFLSNERTIERKVKEAFLAIWLEARLPKNEILKLYLDRAYMGGGTFGVDAAAQYYFGKSARDVNLAEAAMLAGLFKAPSRFAPHINLPAARARANVVLDNLVEAGFMTEGQVFGARRNPAMAVDRRDERSPNYYLDWAFDEMKKLAAPCRRRCTSACSWCGSRSMSACRSTPRRRSKARCAVRPRLPRQAGRHCDDGHRRRACAPWSAAAITARASSTARPTRCASPAPRSSPMSTRRRSRAAASSRTRSWSTSPVCIGNWCPKNYSGGHSGAMTLTQAITRSINVIPVKLSIALGNGNPRSAARRSGETRAQGRASARRCPIRPRCRSAPTK